MFRLHHKEGFQEQLIPKSLDESVDEVDAGKLYQSGEHGREAQDDVDVHSCGVADLEIEFLWLSFLLYRVILHFRNRF